jgi:O-antigen/teichoic acid export membrane protein
MATAGDATDAFELPRAEVRRRSLAGIFFLTSSSVANLVIGFGASLVLARALTPSDFGVVAIGSTAVLLAGALADGGLGAAMVKRAAPPTVAELRTLNGIQLTLTTAICVPAIALSLAFGRTGAVTALMLASLPLTALQAPGRIMLSRSMKYDRQLAVDVTSQVVAQIFTVTSVVLGAGVWGLAAGQVLKAIVATALTAALSIGFTRPSLRGWRDYGPVVRFGLSFQASYYTFVGREQGINIVLGAVGGVTPLGIWSFTNRIFQLPLVAFNSLYVVGFPAMSNLLARGEDAAPIIQRTVRRAAIAGSFVFPPFAAAAPELIPAVFGERWRDVVDVVPFICLSTLILGSIAVAATSYLSASGRPGIVAWASAVFGVVWVAGTAALLPFIGVMSIGVGNLVGAVVEAAILSVATARTAHVSPYRPLLRPLWIALEAGLTGWLLCTLHPDGLPIAAAAATLTLGLNAIGLMLTCRSDLEDTVRLVVGTVRSVVPRPGRTGATSAG